MRWRVIPQPTPGIAEACYIHDASTVLFKVEAASPEQVNLAVAAPAMIDLLERIEGELAALRETMLPIPFDVIDHLQADIDRIQIGVRLGWPVAY